MREFYVVFLSENVDHKKWWDVSNKKQTRFQINHSTNSFDHVRIIHDILKGIFQTSPF